MAKKNIEISLVSIALATPGTSRKKETRHAVTASLVWPRLSVARKESALPCTLAKGSADFSSAPWHETIFFKEAVEGTFGLKASVSDPLSNEALDSFLRLFSGIFLKDIGTLLGKSDLVLSDILSATFTTASRKASSSPSVSNVAEGALTLDAASLRDGDLIQIPLFAPRALSESTVSSSPSGHAPEVSKRTLLRKGTPNGSLTVRIHLL